MQAITVVLKPTEISLLAKGCTMPSTIGKPLASTSCSFSLQNVSDEVLQNSLSHFTTLVLELVEQQD
jgi:Na+-transporting NADH:ubiquinone oxidoreductase subunit NqrF